MTDDAANEGDAVSEASDACTDDGRTRLRRGEIEDLRSVAQAPGRGRRRGPSRVRARAPRWRPAAPRRTRRRSATSGRARSTPIRSPRERCSTR